MTENELFEQYGRLQCDKEVIEQSMNQIKRQIFIQKSNKAVTKKAEDEKNDSEE